MIYCDFSDPKSAEKNYIEIRDLEQLRFVAEGYLEEFNNMSKKPMNLVLFRLVMGFLSLYVFRLVMGFRLMMGLLSL